MMVLGKHMKTVKSGKLPGEKLKLEAETGLTLFDLQSETETRFWQCPCKHSDTNLNLSVQEMCGG